MEIDIRKVTGMGRRLDPWDPTNVAITFLTGIVMVGGVVIKRISGEGWLESGSWGLRAGIAVFLAWALGRELDPDNPRSALVSAGLGLVAVIAWGLPGLLAMLWLLIATRMVNRTTGARATLLDSLGILGLGAWLGYQGSWGYAALTAIVTLADSQLKPENQRQIFFSLVGGLITAVILVLKGNLWSDAEIEPVAVAMSAGLALIFIPVILRSRSLKSVGDANGERLEPRRVQAAQAAALAAGIQAALWRGAEGMVEMIPLWAATSSATLYHLYLALKGDER